MNIPRPIIPKEHGAWAVLFVPMVVGVGATGLWPGRVLFLALSALGIFMSYVPVQILLRDRFLMSQGNDRVRQARVWATAFLALGLFFAIPLLMSGYWLLPAFAAIGVLGFAVNFGLTRRFPKTIPGDLVSVVSLTLTAPAAYYVVLGVLDRTALSIWLLNVLFFGCSVFYVHMKIRATSMKKEELTWGERISLGKLNLIYHAVVLTVVFALAWRHFTPPLAALAFVPMAAHAIYGTYKLSGKVRFKNLGFLLVGQAILFALIMVATK